jgi:hypothetical protein
LSLVLLWARRGWDSNEGWTITDAAWILNSTRIRSFLSISTISSINSPLYSKNLCITAYGARPNFFLTAAYTVYILSFHLSINKRAGLTCGASLIEKETRMMRR